MIRRLAVALACALLLGGCQIVTVLDADDLPEGSGGWFEGVDTLVAWPGGGFLAYECTLGSGWGGRGMVVVRPGEEMFLRAGCDGPSDVAVAPDGSAAYVATTGYDSWVSGVWRVEVPSGVVTPVWTVAYSDDPEGPDGGVWTLVGDIDVADDGTVHVGVQLPGSDSMAIHRVVGGVPVVVPGTEGLGGDDFEVVGEDIVAIDGHTVVQVGPTGVRSVVAGTGTAGFSGDGGSATEAHLDGPIDLSDTPKGGVLIVDAGNHRVRSVSPSGTITTVAGSGAVKDAADQDVEGGAATNASFESVSGVASDTAEGCFWVADQRYDRGVVRFVGPPACPGHPSRTGS